MKCLLLGLRCKASDTCNSWRWTKQNAPLLSNPNRPVCQMTNGCKAKRCLLMTGELKGIKVVSNSARPDQTRPDQVPCCKDKKYVNLHVLEPTRWKNTIAEDVGDGPYRWPENNTPKPRSSLPELNFNSGDKLCYQQMLGQTKGCHLQDIKYGCEAADNEIVITTHSWGECARNCAPPERGDCHFWTWSSHACSNCKPTECKLMTCSDLSSTLSAPGHISGERSCQDIPYVETNEDNVVGVPGNRVNQAGETWEWQDGECAEEEQHEGKIWDPIPCPPQEVPGFRC